MTTTDSLIVDGNIRAYLALGKPRFMTVVEKHWNPDR